jgi:hypothetical protein
MRFALILVILAYYVNSESTSDEVPLHNAVFMANAKINGTLLCGVGLTNATFAGALRTVLLQGGADVSSNATADLTLVCNGTTGTATVNFTVTVALADVHHTAIELANTSFWTRVATLVSASSSLLSANVAGTMYNPGNSENCTFNTTDFIDSPCNSSCYKTRTYAIEHPASNGGICDNKDGIECPCSSRELLGREIAGIVIGTIFTTFLLVLMFYLCAKSTLEKDRPKSSFKPAQQSPDMTA